MQTIDLISVILKLWFTWIQKLWQFCIPLALCFALCFQEVGTAHPFEQAFYYIIDFEDVNIELVKSTHTLCTSDVNII